MPGMPGIADGGALSAVLPSADASGLLGVAMLVHAGGTDSGPSVAALPTPTAMLLPAPPNPDRPEMPDP